MIRYGKFAAQVAATVLAALMAALQNGPLTLSAWLNVVIIGFSAISVLGAGELSSGVWAHTKSIIAALAAGVVVLQTSVNGGFTTVTVIQAVLAALGVLGIFAVPGPVVASVTLKSGLMLKAPHVGRHEGTT